MNLNDYLKILFIFRDIFIYFIISVQCDQLFIVTLNIIKMLRIFILNS